jgi:AcrR family transcriptional regulator
VEITREITDIARARLAAEGAAALSLRAVARDMGMVSSAVYRYFSSRDELLTALIIDGYNAIGEAVENADAACRRGDYSGRWLAACRAARGWAIAHPHEYALIYGSPVPGYQAPADTIGPAARSAVVFGRLVSDAHAAGQLTPLPATQATASPQPAPGLQAMPGSLAEDASRLRDTVLPRVPGDMVIGALTAWAGVFGVISFEVFGQFNNVVTDTAGYFDRAVADLGRLMGLPR